MKYFRYLLLACLTSVFAPMSYAANSNPLSGPGQIQAPAAGTGTLAEVIDVENYVYLRLQEGDKWIATGPQSFVVGDKISYSKGMEMRNFNSRKLNRKFESIFFIQDVRITGKDVDAMHRAAMKAEGMEKVVLPKAAKVQEPAPGEIAPLTDGKSVAEIIADPAKLQDQTVKLRARVIKVSKKIMGKNWITLQDGTGTPPANKLIATSSELVSPGDMVIASGVVKTNVDLGAGYNYKVIIEKTAFTKEQNKASGTQK